MTLQVRSDVPVSFSSPVLFDGVGVSGVPLYVSSCANGTDFNNFQGCRNMKVCVAHGSSAYEIAQQRLHPNQIVQAATLSDMYNQFANGCCNTIATDYTAERSEHVVRDIGGYTGPYVVGSILASSMPV